MKTSRHMKFAVGSLLACGAVYAGCTSTTVGVVPPPPASLTTTTTSTTGGSATTGATAGTGSTTGGTGTSSGGASTTTGGTTAAVPITLIYHFDEAQGASASNGRNQATVQNANWTVGMINTALAFNGVRDCVDSGGPAFDNTQSFTVAAWVVLASTNNPTTIVSQDGLQGSAYLLQYTGSGFSFAITDADSPAANITASTSGFAPIVGVWYHVAGVYDASHGLVTLYVNGQAAPTVSTATTWQATGPTVIGRSLLNGVPANFWNGRIDEVVLYNGAHTAAEVAQLAQTGSSFIPIRPPSVPLAVRSPYLSTWQPYDAIAGSWPTFWNGQIKALASMLQVDGTNYTLLGTPQFQGVNPVPAQQTALEVTPTQSRYTLQAGPMQVYVNFISPVEPTRLDLQSAPFSYIEVQTVSTDGAAHSVQLYMDVTAEMAGGSVSDSVSWTPGTTLLASGQTLHTWDTHLSTQQSLTEENDVAAWGSVMWGSSGATMTYMSGEDQTVRDQFYNLGTLDGTNDVHQPRSISSQWPVFAFAHDLGMVAGTPTPNIIFMLGHVEQPGTSYLTHNQAPLWASYWPDTAHMMADGYTDAANGNMLVRANSLDANITQAAVLAGGAHYAGLCSLALRQAYGAVGFMSDPNGLPTILMKEISSDDNVSSVDVIYPSMPAFLYVNPEHLAMLLAPIYNYVESRNWPTSIAYPPHDIGATYPNAAGHNDGGGENMPVEESANMLIMSDAYLQSSQSPTIMQFAQNHYVSMQKWANYLVANALNPNLQNQTDDFTGPIANSSNLALKGILGIGAMGQVAHMMAQWPNAAPYVGGASSYADDANTYTSISRSYIAQWQALSVDPNGPHLMLAYNKSGTWSLKYNAYPDVLLGLNLIPRATMALEASWYLSHQGTSGIPLDNRHTYTKLDWELWTAASVPNTTLRQNIIDRAYLYANTTSSRVPLSDWYDVQSSIYQQFIARPVVGGVFSILALPH